MEENMKSPESEASAFQREKALRQLGGESEILKELAEAFLDQEPELMQRIRETVGAGDARNLRLAAHTLKGSASVFAAESVVKAANRVESLAREEHLEDSEAAIAELEPLVARLTSELQRFLEER